MNLSDIKNLLCVDNEYLHDLGYCLEDIDGCITENGVHCFDPVLERPEKKIKKRNIDNPVVKAFASKDASEEAPPHPNLLPTPFGMFMVARPGSGKSTVLLNLIQWYEGYFDQIILVSPTFFLDISWQNAVDDGIIDIKPENVMTEFDPVLFQKAVNDIKKKNTGIKSYPEKFRVLFVLDDVVADLPRGIKGYMNKFAFNHRHLGISHVTISQTYVSVPPNFRKCSFGVGLFESDNGLERKAMIDELSGRIGKNRFTRMLDDIAINEEHSFLFIRTKFKMKERYMRNFESIIDYKTYSNECLKGDNCDREEKKKVIEKVVDIEDVKEEDIEDNEFDDDMMLDMLMDMEN